MRCVVECREEKEKKLESACRAKDAMEENPDAFRKGKWLVALSSLVDSMMLCSNEILIMYSIFHKTQLMLV
jgi:hypothetical protein